MSNSPSSIILLDHVLGKVFVESAGEKLSIRVEMNDPTHFVSSPYCHTRYPLNLIKHILAIKGPAYLCDEIARDENPDYVELELMLDLLAYRSPEEFANKRILDFGCGSGASSMIMARHFPSAEILGVELSEKLLSIAEARKNFYHQNHVDFLLSEKGDDLPPEIGKFDYIVLNAVYEHLLPDERKKIIGALWRCLNDQGVLFINETPYRYWFKEFHTTGIYFLNYLPDKLAHHLAKRHSKRTDSNETWKDLLRNGVRGGSESELIRLIQRTKDGRVTILDPNQLGLTDRVDLWGRILADRKKHTAKTKKIQNVAKTIKILTGMTILPTFSIAIEKNCI